MLSSWFCSHIHYCLYTQKVSAVNIHDLGSYILGD
jgi:hypothetical protein